MNVISGHVSNRACSNPSHARLKRFPFGVSQCTLFFGKSFVWSQLKYGITANINSVFLPLYLILRLGVILFTSKPKVAASSKMVSPSTHSFCCIICWSTQLVESVCVMLWVYLCFCIHICLLWLRSYDQY